MFELLGVAIIASVMLIGMVMVILYFFRYREPEQFYLKRKKYK